MSQSTEDNEQRWFADGVSARNDGAPRVAPRILSTWPDPAMLIQAWYAGWDWANDFNAWDLEGDG